MLHGLCASWTHNVVDLIAVAVLIVFAIIAAKKGFVDCFFSLISTIFAISIAFLFMNAILRWTGGLFGLQTLLENGCINALSNVKGFNIDISNEGIEAALADKNLPQFLINTVISEFGNADLAAGTTIARLVGTTLGGFVASLITWLLVFILVKLLLRVVKKMLTSLIEKIPLVGTLNHLLGFGVGAIQGLLIVSGVVAILSIIPAENMTLFFNECVFVKWLYNQNPLNVILGWIIA